MTDALGELEAALHGLTDLPTPAERLEVLRLFVTTWFGPLSPTDRRPQPPTRSWTFPEPLRWWYESVGAKTRSIFRQNELLDAEKTVLRDGLLVFYGENQWVYEWATPDRGDDPAVFGRYTDSGPCELEGPKLTEFLIQASLLEASLGEKCVASTGWLAEDALAAAFTSLTPLPAPPWRWCGEVQFYFGEGSRPRPC